MLGKTVTTEFACWIRADPQPVESRAYARRLEQWLGRGGGMGMCLAAVGTQTGGSITRPASYCGVAGWKPTFI